MIAPLLLALLLQTPSPAPAAGVALRASAPERVTLGEPVAIEVTLENGGEETLALRAAALDAVSFDFRVRHGAGRTGRYTRYAPRAGQASTVPRAQLAPGDSLAFTHELVLPAAGTWTFEPAYHGLPGAPLTAEPLVIEVAPQEGATALHARLETARGAITAAFWTDVAPATSLHVASLVRAGAYDGTTFHRTLPGFMIQGGDPKGDGTGGPGYSIEAEFSDRPHDRGVWSMARNGDPIETYGRPPRREFANSAGSQFFLMHGRSSHLDGKYTAFGRVVDGLEVVDAIATAPAVRTPYGEPSQPVTPVVIEKAALVPAGS